MTPDIIEGSGAAEALRQQFDLLSALVGNAGEGLYTVDSQAHFTFINPAAERMLGWPAGELLGRHVHETIHFQHADGTPYPAGEYPLLDVLRSGKSISDHEEAFTRRDKSLLPVLCSSAPIIKGGRVTGAVMSFHDITERKHAEEALRQWEYIFNHAGWGVAAAHPETNRLTMVNPAFARMHGYTVEEMVGMPLSDTFAPESRGELPPHVAAAHERGDYVYESLHVRKDGATFPCLTHVSALRDEAGRVLYRAATFQDITERKRAEKLAAAQKRTLELVAQGAPLPDVLEVLTRTVEEQSDEGVLASILLLDQDGRHLRHGAAPSLPESYNRAIDGIAIGPHVGSCGTAVYLGEPVVVCDIAGDPLWADYRDLASGHGLQACWSTPIFSSEGRVLGTFAMYYRERRDPTPRDLELIRILTQTAAIAIERKQSEETLRESEARYRILFASVPVAVFACDRNAVIQHYNRRAVELWGREPTCGVEKHCGSLKLYLPDGSLLPHQQSPMVEVLRTGVSANNVEVFIERPDGSRIPVIVNFAALKDARGEIVGAITTFDDITELKRAEEALRDSAERFRSLAESMPQKIFTARPNGEVDYFNGQWTEFTGLSFDEIRDWGWTQFIHPDDVDENVRRWQRSIDTGEPFQFEHRFRRADGEYRWHLSHAHAMRDAHGRVLMWIGSNTDIDDVKRVQEERAQLLERESRAHSEAEAARRRLHDLFMQAPAIICTLRGPEHVFELANPLYVQVTGRRDASDLVGKSVREALPEIEGQGFFELLDKVYRTGEPFVGNEVPVKLDRRGDGTLDEGFFNLVYQPSLDAGGEIDGILVHAVEVTEQVRARQRVEETNRVKDEFLATLSHELRTPLTAILGWARMLSNGQLDATNMARALETIERNAKAQQQLIEDILDVSRVITGKLRLEVQPVDIAAVIEAAVDGVLPAADAKGIRLQRVLDSGTSMVSGDPTRLQQIVWNLLSNAIKFTPKGGRVQVRLERINSHVEVVVTDSGQGINTEVLPYIFERFRQADSTTTRAHGGLGLGLAIVRHLVEMHGGTVEAESGGEGQGATFTVKLPLLVMRSLDVRRAGDAERVHPTASGGVPFNCPPELDGLHILIVDDEEDTRLLLKMVLEKCGAKITMVSSAAEGLAALKASRPDVLISDLGMPDEDGYSLIKQVRALPIADGGQTPAAALTAYARVEDRMRVLRSGFQIHIPKPVEPAELVAVVANLAGRIGAG